jgi:hypothetical protein
MLSLVLAELSEEEMAALLVGMRAVLAARRRLLATRPAREAGLDRETPPAE